MLEVDINKTKEFYSNDIELCDCLYCENYLEACKQIDPHVVGKLVEGEYCTDSEWNDSNTAKIENFAFVFEKELMFLHDDFPHPVLQLDFEA